MRETPNGALDREKIYESVSFDGITPPSRGWRQEKKQFISKGSIERKRTERAGQDQIVMKKNTKRRDHPLSSWVVGLSVSTKLGKSMKKKLACVTGKNEFTGTAPYGGYITNGT